eukprot:14806086-Alexandrium_andersonii.AAC.1
MQPEAHAKPTAPVKPFEDGSAEFGCRRNAGRLSIAKGPPRRPHCRSNRRGHVLPSGTGSRHHRCTDDWLVDMLRGSVNEARTGTRRGASLITASTHWRETLDTP